MLVDDGKAAGQLKIKALLDGSEAALLCRSAEADEKMDDDDNKKKTDYLNVANATASAGLDLSCAKADSSACELDAIDTDAAAADTAAIAAETITSTENKPDLMNDAQAATDLLLSNNE